MGKNLPKEIIDGLILSFSEILTTGPTSTHPEPTRTGCQIMSQNGIRLCREAFPLLRKIARAIILLGDRRSSHNVGTTFRHTSRTRVRPVAEGAVSADHTGRGNSLPQMPMSSLSMIKYEFTPLGLARYLQLTQAGILVGARAGKHTEL